MYISFIKDKFFKIRQGNGGEDKSTRTLLVDVFSSDRGPSSVRANQDPLSVRANQDPLSVRANQDPI